MSGGSVIGKKNRPAIVFLHDGSISQFLHLVHDALSASDLELLRAWHFFDSVRGVLRRPVEGRIPLELAQWRPRFINVNVWKALAR